MTVELLSHFTNCKLLSTIDQSQDEEAWLAVRTRGIGGSDIGAICGVSPFSSAKTVYFSKTGQYSDAVAPNKGSIERMHFGHMLESVVADEYALRTGHKLIDLKATFVHKDYPWALANIDRLIVDENNKPIGILECKTTSEYNNSEWESGEILMSYIYQLNWYMWIMGIPYGAFACLVGGNKFYHYEVFRNDELIENTMFPAAKHFWFENVLKLVEPEMQATDSELAKNLFSEVVKGSEITLADDVTNDLADTVVKCKAKIKELESTMEEAQNRIKDRLKSNEIGYTKDFTIKWSPRSQVRVDTTKLKALYPEIYSAVQMKVDFRVMTIKGGKDE